MDDPEVAVSLPAAASSDSQAPASPDLTSAAGPEAHDADAPAFVGTSTSDAPESGRGPVTGSVETALTPPVPHAGLRYAGLRLLMLASVGAILYVIGLRGWLLAFSAVLISGLASLFLLMKQRNDAAVNLEHTVDHWKQRRAGQDAGLTSD